MRAVLTGASSFFGRALSEYLLREGHQVGAVLRAGSTGVLVDGVVDAATLDGADVFFHIGWGGAGPVGRADAAIQRSNVEYTRAMIDRAGELGCTMFVMFGSQAEYGSVKGIIAEDTPCEPTTEYGRAKLEISRIGGELCAARGMKYLHLRIFSVYGPGDHPWTLVSSLVERLSRGEDVEMSSCRQSWNFLYIADAARAIVNLAESEAEGVYNMASTDTRELREFVEEARAVIGGQGRLIYGDQMGHGIEPSVAKLMLALPDLHFTPFAEGMRAMTLRGGEERRGEERRGL